MQIRHMPKASLRYWTAITLASLFGTNLGDVYAHDSGLGLLGGLPILAALAALIFLIEHRDRTPRETYYWLVIIIIRTGATNIADYFKKIIAWPLFALILAVIFGVFAWASAFGNRAEEKAAEDSKGMPRTGAAYWCAMLGAGVLGTFYGDATQHLIGRWEASLLLGAILLASLAVWRGLSTSRFWLYWVVVAVARTAGTAMGDFLAESDLIGIGLLASTAITGTAFILTLIAWPRSTGKVVPIAG